MGVPVSLVCLCACMLFVLLSGLMLGFIGGKTRHCKECKICRAIPAVLILPNTVQRRGGQGHVFCSVS